MSARLEKAQLMLTVGHVEIPLADLIPDAAEATARVSKLHADAAGFSAPSVRPPELSGAFDVEVPPLRTYAISEVLRHTRSARVEVTLPLRPFSRSIGPLKIDVGTGHVLNVTIEVEEGRIIREATAGHIEPPLELPLKAELRGVRLAADGAVVVDIKGFPDFTPSRLGLSGFRVPEFLEDLVSLLPQNLFGQDKDTTEPPREETTEAGTSGSGPAAPSREDIPVDLDRIVVRAVNIRPRPEAFELFGLGTITFAEGTVLQMDFAQGHLTCAGRVLVENAAVRGRRFSVAGVSLSGTFQATFDGDRPREGFALDVNGDDGHLDRLALVLADGSHVVVKDGACTDINLSYAKDGDEEHVHIKTTHAEGEVAGARFLAHIAGQPHHVDVAQMHVAGALDVSERFYHADLQLKNARARVENLVLPMGIARFWLALAEAQATGRLVMGTDFGLSFSGELMAHGAVRAGELSALGLVASVDEGTTADILLREIAVGDGGIDMLKGSGTLKLKLRSGSIPLFTGAAMQFSRGATGTLNLADIALTPEHRFVSLVGDGELVARSDATPLTTHFILPAGIAHMRAERLGLGHDGRAFANDVRLWVESDPDDPPLEG